jgi:hypothetical protein
MKIDKELDANVRRYMEMSKDVDQLKMKTNSMDKNTNTNLGAATSQITKIEKRIFYCEDELE